MTNLKAVLTTSIGGALEWYDFAIYGFFVHILGDLFFPFSNKTEQHIFIFSIFALGYFARPLGSLFFGHFGDKYGRCNSVYRSMFLIGLTTFIAAFLPTYSQIGITATILFILLRILQGFALGGSITGSVVYIAESSPPKKRAFWISLIFTGVNRGSLLAGGVSTLLITYLPPSELASFGWRIAFLLGSSVMLIALYAYRELGETTFHNDLKKQCLIVKAPIKLLFTKYKLVLLRGIGLSCMFGVTIAFNIIYMTTFLKHYGMNDKQVGFVALTIILIFASTTPFFGLLVDKIGVRRMLLISCVTVMADVNLCLKLIISNNQIEMGIGIILFSISSALIIATLPAAIVNLFPTRIRYTGVSLAYNVCVAIFSGLTPLLITTVDKLVHSLQNSIAIVIFSGALLTFLTSLTLKPKHDLFKEH